MRRCRCQVRDGSVETPRAGIGDLNVCECRRGPTSFWRVWRGFWSLFEFFLGSRSTLPSFWRVNVCSQMSVLATTTPQSPMPTRRLGHALSAAHAAGACHCEFDTMLTRKSDKHEHKDCPPERRPDEAKSIDPIDLKLGVVPANSHDCPATMPDPAIYHHLSPLPPGVVLPRSKP